MTETKETNLSEECKWRDIVKKYGEALVGHQIAERRLEHARDVLMSYFHQYLEEKEE